MYKSEVIDIFYPGLDYSQYYRIPTLARLANGDLIAGIDQRQTTESDYGGVIEPALRIRKSGEDDFSDLIKVLKHPKDKNASPSYSIDMSLTPSSKDPNKIYMLIDKFRSKGNYMASQKGTGFIKKDGKDYRLLFEHPVNSLLFNKELNRYYLKDGIVYSLDGKKSPYKVIEDDTYPYDRLGNLYKDNELIGNIYLETSALTVHQSPYLWFLESSDGGKSFDRPIDITAQVATDDMMFIGACPGRGLCLDSGRIVFPIYYTIEDPDDIYRKLEKAALIYSDDSGRTWQISNSPSDLKTTDGKEKIDTSESQIVSLNDGTIIMFSRTTEDKIVYARSFDKGESFEGELSYVDFDSEAFCMISALKYEKDDKEYILISNPKGPGRINGEIKVLEISDDYKIKTIGKKSINSTNFTYSAIEYIGDDSFGLVYEQKQNYKNEARQFIKYTEFDLEWLLSKGLLQNYE